MRNHTKWEFKLRTASRYTFTEINHERIGYNCRLTIECNMDREQMDSILEAIREAGDARLVFIRDNEAPSHKEIRLPAGEDLRLGDALVIREGQLYKARAANEQFKTGCAACDLPSGTKATLLDSFAWGLPDSKDSIHTVANEAPSQEIDFFGKSYSCNPEAPSPLEAMELLADSLVAASQNQAPVSEVPLSPEVYEALRRYDQTHVRYKSYEEELIDSGTIERKIKP
jgi:hypothetical protein